MFKVDYSNQALKFLKGCDKILVRRILDKINILKEKPFISDVKILSSNFYRVRVGSICILYEVDYRDNLLGIVKIDKRSKVYD